ncbi:MAG TPA: ATP-dependent DNA helicase [Actinomycetota bacterium]|nr:ATP-dependent DNA helicase [Actinomycetota bacterium]
MSFAPDPSQSRVLEHADGPLLVTGGPGTGKTAVLRERFARLIEGGADPERVALVVGSGRARRESREHLLGRLPMSLPDLRVMTIHGLAYHVMGLRHGALDYDAPPEILPAADQFSRVRDLLAGEDQADWPAYGSMLRLRGFADQVRQFLARSQEALLKPEDIRRRAADAGLSGWAELAGFLERYQRGLDDQGLVDFAGLVEQAAAAAPKGEPPYDHLLVDDYQDTTFAAEALLSGLRPATLVVAGSPDAHVFSFQGSTDEPIRHFVEHFPGAGAITLDVNHRSPQAVSVEALTATHESEELGAVTRALRRFHVDEGIPWNRLAVVVRRQSTQAAGLVRALDDAGIPRWTSERGLSLAAEPATAPLVLALRWLAAPDGRDALVESVLTSDLARVAPALARGMVRTAVQAGQSPADALEHTGALPEDVAGDVHALRETLARAEAVAERSALDAFAILWRALPSSRRLVEEADREPRARRDLDAVVAFAGTVAASAAGGERPVAAFLADLDAGAGGPGTDVAAGPQPDAVRVLTAHGAVGTEFDVVVVVGAVEGNFPSLSRPEPMFDLAVLERRVSQSERNRLRLADERRLFRMVLGRARRAVVLTATDRQDDDTLSARSRFVEEAGATWRRLDGVPGAPLSTADAAATWRRALARADTAAPRRLAAIEGLSALGAQPARWWFQRGWTDTGRPLREGVRVSYSRLSTLENCELQYVLNEELGLGSPSGYQAWVGHLVHTLIEEYENGDLPQTLEGLIDAAGQRWRQAEFPSFAVSHAFRRLVTEVMLPNWHRTYGESPSLGREVRFEFAFDGATVSGVIDRIESITSGGNRIVDYKTGKADKAGKADENLQLGIYTIAVDEAAELQSYQPIRAVQLAFVRGREGREGVAPVGWQPSGDERPAYLDGMRERLSGLIGRIRTLTEDEVYRPNPGANCRFCDFKTLCSLWPEGAPVFPVAEGLATTEPDRTTDVAETPVEASILELELEPEPEPVEPERAESEPVEPGLEPDPAESVPVTSWGQAAFPLEGSP